MRDRVNPFMDATTKSTNLWWSATPVYQFECILQCHSFVDTSSEGFNFANYYQFGKLNFH